MRIPSAEGIFLPSIRHAGSEWKQPVCDQTEDAAAGTDAHGPGPDAESKRSGCFLSITHLSWEDSTVSDGFLL